MKLKLETAEESAQAQNVEFLKNRIKQWAVRPWDPEKPFWFSTPTSLVIHVFRYANARNVPEADVWAFLAFYALQALEDSNDQLYDLIARSPMPPLIMRKP